jgi:hypothetical protein
VKTKSNNRIPVMVTTEHKGVFFGYTPPLDFAKPSIRIEDARACLYWGTSVKGVLGLAATGPNTDCRVGPKVPAITLDKVTSVTEVSEAAAKAWEVAPWS